MHDECWTLADDTQDVRMGWYFLWGRIVDLDQIRSPAYGMEIVLGWDGMGWNKDPWAERLVTSRRPEGNESGSLRPVFGPHNLSVIQ